MERTKPPVLTSPWKIGFFVSLMLVFVAIGITFFFARSMGTPWLPSLTEWRTIGADIIEGKGAFVNVWPAMVLVGVASLLSYLAITGAVRKYKRYLDSGHDYKQLLRSIREIKDLDDADRIEGLKNHDELREFLNKIKAHHDERTRMLDEREKALESSVMATEKKKEEELSNDLNEQCGHLIEAIVRGFPEPVAITMPELKLVEEAVRDKLAAAKQQPALADAANHSDSTKLQEAAETAWRELEETAKAVRELEAELGSTRAGGTGSASDSETTRRDLESLAAAWATLEGMTSELERLGEESKSVAINTALQAGSGKSTQADLVKLAEDVKEMAAQYGDMSKTLRGELESARRAADSISSSVHDASEAGPSRGEGLGALSGKVSHVADRVTNITQRLKNVTGASETTSETGDLSDEGFVTMDADETFLRRRGDAVGGGFKSLTERESIFSKESAPIEQDARDADAESGFGEIDGAGEASDPAETSESERSMFAELSEDQPESSTGKFVSSDDAIAAAMDRVDREAPLKESGEPKSPQVAPPKQDNFIDTAGLEIDSFAGSNAGAVSGDVAVEEGVEDAIDLYELGAVVYDPAVHG